MSARYLTLSGECSNVLIYDSMAARPTEPAAVAAALSATTTSTPTESSTGSDAVLTSPSSIFTTEVHYWSALISEWAAAYQIDPNLIATVIQIESCGNPSISSSAGAQGLFQVMPFHFAAGEDMLDVQTNALRGLTYLQGALELAAGDVELALAAYNGGYGVITRGRASWMPETQRYSSWGSRIYAEAVSGMTTSVTLQEWLAAGGSSLCASASESQRLIE
jgi:soluble lytic murein transglycosylase-like protein